LLASMVGSDTSVHSSSSLMSKMTCLSITVRAVS
jgi:hypothetical protein